MINTQHRNVADYDDLLLKYAKELIEGDAEVVGTEEEVPVEKPKQRDNQQSQWGFRRNGQKMSFEVDFEIFRDRFIP